jgi:hypothetical protein
MTKPWWRPLRELNDALFAGPEPGIGWQEHVKGLNATYGLDGLHKLSTFPRPELPPAWFIGDVTAVTPGEWVLVFSLNPAEDQDTDFYYGRDWSPANFWEYQVSWLREWWNESYHGPLARVAQLATDSVSTDERSFAGDHIIFAELCPYASKRFAISQDSLLAMSRTDAAFKAEAAIVEAMLIGGEPKLVLVNGNAAISAFQTLHGPDLDWSEVHYESESAPGKKLWHTAGMLTLAGRRTPIAGFPFIRKPRTHNWAGELEQLGRYLSALAKDQMGIS